MINYAKKSYFDIPSVRKEYEITIEGSSDKITNAYIDSESIEVVEMLCSEQTLHFGSCESSSIKFAIKADTVAYSLVGKVITVNIILANDRQRPFTLGTYKVEQDKKVKDGFLREVIAYDSLFEVNNIDVAAWYNTLFPNESTTKTIKQMRDSFMNYVGLEQVSATLVNDSMVVKKTLNPTSLSGATVLNAICEINGVFGHITRDNKFKYVQLIASEEALYPSNDLYPANTLFPSDGNIRHILGSGSKAYKSCNLEEYQSKAITQLVIKNSVGEVAKSIGSSGNTYTISNFLTYGSSSQELTTIASALYNVIRVASYYPCDVVTSGNPCYEVGDNIKLHTKSGVYPSYILERSLTGAQALMDEIYADGTEYHDEQLNFTSSELRSVANAYSSITKTVSSISLEVGSLDGEVSSLSVDVGKVWSQVYNADGSSKIEQMATSISAKVNSDDLTASFVIGIINEESTAQISASKINLSGYVTVTDLSGEGKTTINGSNITTGKISADRIDANLVTIESLASTGITSSDGVYQYQTKISSQYLTMITHNNRSGETYVGVLSSDQLSLPGGEVSCSSLNVGSHDLSFIEIDGHHVLGYD